MNSLRKLGQRLYADYLMPERLHLYDRLLGQAARAGYAQMGVRDYLALAPAARGRTLLLRHDVDTDPGTARAMFDIERRHGVRASYYFRRTTVDCDLMRAIEAYGSEASYHFEEIADFVKLHRIHCVEQLRARMGEIEDCFYFNFVALQRRTGIVMRTVASHGDFVNRRLGVINHELLQNQALRARCGIECEAYDARLLADFDAYISDRPYPVRFAPCSPFDALGRYERIYFTTHPAHWRTNWHETSKHNLRRLVEAWQW